MQGTVTYKNMTNLTSRFPSQKKSLAQKTKKWRKDSVQGAIALALNRDEGVRASYKNKVINFNLYSDILDPKDVEKICNPSGLTGKMTAPAKLQNMPIANPKIDLLYGESINRKFDFAVRVLNPDAISEKENKLKDEFTQLLTSHIKEDKSEEEMKKALADFQQYSEFEFQDFRERSATQILNYLYKHLRLDYKFANGFKDALISSEEIFQVDIVGQEPVLNKLNVLNVHTVRTGESNYIEDSDIIAIRGKMSPGQIIDTFYDELKQHEIARIDGGFKNADEAEAGQGGLNIGRTGNAVPMAPEGLDIEALAGTGDADYSAAVDDGGNITVTHVLWKSLRKVKRVKYYDQHGDAQSDIMDETYEIDKAAGEEEKILWISEWWEGTEIGGTNGLGSTTEPIYLQMRPRKVQFRSAENPSLCHPGVVGTVYNTNGNSGMSLMDRMKPYQYLYNILAYNVNLSISKNYGKIMSLDLAEVPGNWKIDKWLGFAQNMGIAVKDSFKEGVKGSAQGKLAGQMQKGSAVIDMEMGNTIQLYMNMMAFIKDEMGEIAGVSKGRQGQISNRSTSGNVEREVSQSSHITEYWFMEHDETKLRCLQLLLETAKCAWSDKTNKKVQHVLDDGSTALINMDLDKFRESELGLLITSGAGSHGLRETMKQLAHAGIQNGLINYTQLMDIFSSESQSAVRRKLEKVERVKEDKDAKAAQQQQEMQQQMIQHQAKQSEIEKDFIREGWSREDDITKAKLDNDIVVERMRQDNNDSNSFKDTRTDDSIAKLAEIRREATAMDKEYKLKNRVQTEVERHNKAHEATEKSKNKLKNK